MWREASKLLRSYGMTTRRHLTSCIPRSFVVSFVVLKCVSPVVSSLSSCTSSALRRTLAAAERGTLAIDSLLRFFARCASSIGGKQNKNGSTRRKLKSSDIGEVNILEGRGKRRKISNSMSWTPSSMRESKETSDGAIAGNGHMRFPLFVLFLREIAACTSRHLAVRRNFLFLLQEFLASSRGSLYKVCWCFNKS